jgi:hypothetical protein
MDESAHANKPDPEPPTPEVAQLLKLIELQTAAQRSRHAGRPTIFEGVSFRYGSLIVIVVFALGSVGIMEWVLSQLPRPVHSIPAGMALPGGKSGAVASNPGVAGPSKP